MKIIQIQVHVRVFPTCGGNIPEVGLHNMVWIFHLLSNWKRNSEWGSLQYMYPVTRPVYPSPSLSLSLFTVSEWTEWTHALLKHIDTTKVSLPHELSVTPALCCKLCDLTPLAFCMTDERLWHLPPSLEQTDRSVCCTNGQIDQGHATLLRSVVSPVNPALNSLEFDVLWVVVHIACSCQETLYIPHGWPLCPLFRDPSNPYPSFQPKRLILQQSLNPYTLSEPTFFPGAS